MKMYQKNGKVEQEKADNLILAELKAENKIIGRCDSELLDDLSTENLLLTLQNENERLRMEERN